MMLKLKFSPSLLLAAGIFLTAAPVLAADEPVAAPEVKGSLVMFLTQTDPMLAGHALHFATHMIQAGRSATILLVGEAGRLAVKDSPTPNSAVDGNSLQQGLISFIDAGGQVYITPFTLASFKAEPGDLIVGARLPENPKAIHAHMFEPDTQLVVW